jgi:hypothetical protein
MMRGEAGLPRQVTVTGGPEEGPGTRVHGIKHNTLACRATGRSRAEGKGLLLEDRYFTTRGVTLKNMDSDWGLGVFTGGFNF